MITIERFSNSSMTNKDSHIKAITLCQDNGAVVSKTLFFDAIDKYIETEKDIFLSLAKSLTRTRAIDWRLMGNYLDKWSENEWVLVLVDNIIKESDFQFMKKTIVGYLLNNKTDIPIQIGLYGGKDRDIRIEAIQKMNTITNETYWKGEPSMSKIFISVDDFIGMKYNQLIDLYYED